jgi:hypothetical protein
MKRSLLFVFLLGAVAALRGISADDLTGAASFLCSAQTVSVCTPEDHDCEGGPASTWNIPQFIQVDLTAKRLSTTKSSGQNRSTPIENLLKRDGSVYLQGVENGRAFSIRIDEATGEMSAAVARDGVVVAVFGMCTPGGAR